MIPIWGANIAAYILARQENFYPLVKKPTTTVKLYCAATKIRVLIGISISEWTVGRSRIYILTLTLSHNRLISDHVYNKPLAVGGFVFSRSCWITSPTAFNHHENFENFLHRICRTKLSCTNCIKSASEYHSGSLITTKINIGRHMIWQA